MDKPRAKLRIKQSGHKLFGGIDDIAGDFQFPEKSKKGKVRSLSAVARALSSNCSQDYEMGCDLTEKVNALPAQSPSPSIIATNKRFKIPKKFFDDCNGVDHASVPRKLRSAMRKRNRVYSLPDSEKVNHKLNGIESPEKDGIKRTKKQGSPDWSMRQTVSGSITKDEEEVVETLYALAGMFPNNGSSDTSKLDDGSLPENSVLQDIENGTNAAFGASEVAQYDINLPCAEGSPREAAKTNSLNGTISQKQSDLLENAKFPPASDGIGSKLTLPPMPSLVKSENSNEVPLNDSGLLLAMGLNMPRQSPISQTERKPAGMAVEMDRAVEYKQERQTIKGRNKNDSPILWPGLSLATSSGSYTSFLQPSAAKAPVWLDAATCASKRDLTQRVSFGGKISEVATHKKSRKRCAVHVHISNLIRNLQVPNNSKEELMQPSHQTDQLKPNEGSAHGIVIKVENLNRVSSGITSVSGSAHSDTMKDSQESKNSILQQPRRYHDIPQEAPIPDVYGPQKQSFDLLSLSARGNGLKLVSNRFDKSGGSRLQQLSTLQVSYFQPLAQQHGLMRFPVPQNQYTSTPSYLNQISVEGPQVLPPYYGNPLWGSRNNPTASNKQQQQNFWAMQVGAGGEGQGRGSGLNCNVMMRAHQYSNWENGRQDHTRVCGPAVSMAPHLLVGSKLTPMSSEPHHHHHHQQQLIALASSSSPSLSKTNGLDFHLPSLFVDQSRGSRFRPNSATPSLQLLCDERV